MNPPYVSRCCWRSFVSAIPASLAMLLCWRLKGQWPSRIRSRSIPLDRGTNLRIRIRTKMSRIRNTDSRHPCGCRRPSISDCCWRPYRLSGQWASAFSTLLLQGTQVRTVLNQVRDHACTHRRMNYKVPSSKHARNHAYKQ